MDLLETHQMTREQESAHWWIRTRFGYLAQELERSCHESREKLRVLEVGCGTGQNLAFIRTEFALRERIASVTGIDPHLQTPLPNIPGLLENDSIGPSLAHVKSQPPFDFILAMDVLEHIENDRSALSDWLTWLRPKGRLLLTVPAFPALWSKHDERLAHYRRYTRRTLEPLLQELPVDMDRMHYAFSYVAPAVFLIRKLGLGARAGSDLQPTAPWLNTILRNLGEWERRAGGNRWIGTSLVVSVRKRA